MKFEFKVTVHHDLWAKSIKLWPLKALGYGTLKQCEFVWPQSNRWCIPQNFTTRLLWATACLGRPFSRLYFLTPGLGREPKIGRIQCKISSKKGGVIRCGHQKNGGLFWCRLPKMGVIPCAKMQFQGKICQFSFKIATKSLNFSKCARSAQKFENFYVKFDTKVEKRGSLGVDWIKKGDIGCRIGVKKGVYWQALDIHQHMECPPPPAKFSPKPPPHPNLVAIT